jgi:putative MFS transporter
MGVVAIAVMAPTLLALVLVILFGRETRGRDLRDLERR